MSHRFSSYAHSLYSVVKQLKVRGLITASLSQAEFSQLIKPIGERPLILTAHPGDDVMAMGGTMATYAAAGLLMTTLTFTEGLHGTNSGRLSQALGPRRQKEALAAYKEIGGEIKPLFWDFDENFVVDQELVFTLLEVIDDLNPDVIYVPSLFDDHPDNQAMSEALVQVLHRLPSPRLKDLWIGQYELWTPLVPNKILNIDDYTDVKRKAIECHESQLLCRDYLEAVLGLNRYRAAILGAGSNAEAYFMCRAPQYLAFQSQPSARVMTMVDKKKQLD